MLTSLELCNVILGVPEIRLTNSKSSDSLRGILFTIHIHGQFGILCGSISLILIVHNEDTVGIHIVGGSDIVLSNSKYGSSHYGTRSATSVSYLNRANVAYACLLRSTENKTVRFALPSRGHISRTIRDTSSIFCLTICSTSHYRCGATAEGKHNFLNLYISRNASHNDAVAIVEINIFARILWSEIAATFFPNQLDVAVRIDSGKCVARSSFPSNGCWINNYGSRIGFFISHLNLSTIKCTVLRSIRIFLILYDNASRTTSYKFVFCRTATSNFGIVFTITLKRFSTNSNGKKRQSLRTSRSRNLNGGNSTRNVTIC